MNTRSSIPRQLVAFLALAGLGGCAYDPYYPQSVDVYATHPAPAVVYYDYDYYPELQVYWHAPSGYYWYYSDHHWIHSRHLPGYYHLHRHKPIKKRAPARYPYRRQHEHSVRHDRPEKRYLDRDVHDKHVRPQPPVHDSVLKGPAAHVKSSPHRPDRTHRDTPRADERQRRAPPPRHDETRRSPRETPPVQRPPQRDEPPQKQTQHSPATIKGRPELYRHD